MPNSTISVLMTSQKSKQNDHYNSHIDGAIGVNKYYVKTEHLCFLTMNEWKANGKLLCNLLRSGIVSDENVSCWHI